MIKNLHEYAETNVSNLAEIGEQVVLIHDKWIKGILVAGEVYTVDHYSTSDRTTRDGETYTEYFYHFNVSDLPFGFYPGRFQRCGKAKQVGSFFD